MFGPSAFVSVTLLMIDPVKARLTLNAKHYDSVQLSDTTVSTAKLSEAPQCTDESCSAPEIRESTNEKPSEVAAQCTDESCATAAVEPEVSAVEVAAPIDVQCNESAEVAVVNGPEPMREEVPLDDTMCGEPLLSRRGLRGVLAGLK